MGDGLAVTMSTSTAGGGSAEDRAWPTTPMTRPPPALALGRAMRRPVVGDIVEVAGIDAAAKPDRVDVDDRQTRRSSSPRAAGRPAPQPPSQRQGAGERAWNRLAATAANVSRSRDALGADRSRNGGQLAVSQPTAKAAKSGKVASAEQVEWRAAPAGPLVRAEDPPAAGLNQQCLVVGQHVKLGTMAWKRRPSRAAGRAAVDDQILGALGQVGSRLFSTRLADSCGQLLALYEGPRRSDLHVLIVL